MFNNITVIVDEITAILLKPLSQYVKTSIFTCNNGIDSDVVIAAKELNELISDPHESYIFVASSIGAFTGLTYVHKYPNKLMGLIPINPSHPMQGISVLAILTKCDILQSKDLADLKKSCVRTNEVSESGNPSSGLINRLYWICGLYNTLHKCLVSGLAKIMQTGHPGAMHENQTHQDGTSRLG